VTTPAKTLRFLDLFHAGTVTADEIDAYITAWHDDRANVPVHVYLGLTWAEYRTWLCERWLPTPAEHAAEREDAVWIGGDDEKGFLLRVHPPANCRPVCPIHWPSNHPLAGAPLWWDHDQGFMSRCCSHGIAHPDPDDQQVRLHPELRDHDGCDGCCTAVVLDGMLLHDDSEPDTDLLRAIGRTARHDATRRPR
jgi:hypothetical protein